MNRTTNWNGGFSASWTPTNGQYTRYAHRHPRHALHRGLAQPQRHLLRPARHRRRPPLRLGGMAEAPLHHAGNRAKPDGTPRLQVISKQSLSLNRWAVLANRAMLPTYGNLYHIFPPRLPFPNFFCSLSNCSKK